MITNILVSISGSANSMIAAKYAICLSRLLKARLSAVYVVNSSILSDLLKSRIFVEMEARNYERDLEMQGKLLLEKVRKMAESKNVVCEEFLLKGEVCDEMINKAADIKADILVMGEVKEITSRVEIFHDEGERISRRAPCPVVLVRNQNIVEDLYKEIV